ncbi:MAG: 3-deoxy-manno-octulosonate cytidylyltransferase [Deltaproteobacteria bacterium]|nr:3-deoxy-manno-octulosonate cytidylyltransferase [Deltaproteobacteria bacterium]MBW2121790.1 3-deoxy-manno-octulosonate cytidylyltransferase [Deltaproteobacteria bacterium]
MQDRAVAVIPARLHSTRLPRKVLLDIAGKPMLRHVYDRTRSARSIRRVLVATDSTEVADPVREWGGEVVVTDPGLPSGTARIASIVDSLDGEIIVNVQGDQPLVEPTLIDGLVRAFEGTGADIVTPVFRVTRVSDLTDPGIAKVVRARDGRALYFSRSPIPYVRDVPMAEWPKRATFWAQYGIYGFRRRVLVDFNASLPPSALEKAEKLEQLRFLEAGYAIHTFTTRFRQVAVDTPEDLARVRAILESRPKGEPD